MKTILKYLTAFLFYLLVYSCSEPNPTELTPDDASGEEEFSVEVLAKDPENYDYATGYDSTGVIEPSPGNSALISISGIKTSRNNTVDKALLALAVFYDRNQPVQNSMGRIIGFKTRIFGRVSFDSDSALIVPHRINYFDKGIRKDTLLGLKHVLLKTAHGNSPFDIFPYNSAVTFSLQPILMPEVRIAVPTPEEITGSVEIIGRRDERNLAFILKWNAVNRGETEIILGGQRKGDRRVFPFYRIKTADDGLLRIPSRMLVPIPFDQYDKIVITFIRRRVKEFYQQQIFDNSFISAQSIHNIIINVPD